MPKTWTGKLVGIMHDNHITGRMLAEKLGVTDRYVSMVLNGHREPVGARDRFESAVKAIIRETERDSDA